MYIDIQYKNKLLGLLKIRTSTSDYIDEKLACQLAASLLQSHCCRILLLKILQAQIK